MKKMRTKRIRCWFNFHVWFQCGKEGCGMQHCRWCSASKRGK